MRITGFIKASLFIGGMLFIHAAHTQELYVFTEPASNMPSKSISGKVTGKFVKRGSGESLRQRYIPEVMFGLNRNWMVHLSPSFSDMFSSNMRWESAKVYAKYRFYSNDEVHRHFRMAAFSELAYSRSDSRFNEINLNGDQSGIRGGLILTKLQSKLAVSSTLSLANVFTKNKHEEPGNEISKRAFDYSLSAGYLVLPVNYTSFNQTNLNVYAEFLGQQSLDRKQYFVDLAPAVQLIFNSNSKLNLGYRFQLDGNMYRMATRGWLIGFERTFLR